MGTAQQVRDGQYVLDLRIGVAKFATTGTWRAATRIEDVTISSGPETNPVRAIQALLMKVGAGHDQSDIAIESALSGGDLFGLLDPSRQLTDGS